MILAFDTSTSVLSVALVRDREIVAEYAETAHRNHSAALVPAIDRVLQEAGTEVAGLKAIAVGRGPGSYTGVRIAVTVAKTLAWSAGVKLIGVSSLRTIAAGAMAEEGDWIVPLIDARRGHAYTALFEKTPAGVRRHAPDKKRPVKEWAEELAERAGQEARKLIFAGEIGSFQADLMPLIDRSGGRVKQAEAPMQARYAAFHALEQVETAPASPEAVHTFVPDYTQPAEVELKFMNKGS